MVEVRRKTVENASGFPCLTAFGTAFWLISTTFGLKILLLFNAEGKACSATGTLERLILKTRLDDLLLVIS